MPKNDYLGTILNYCPEILLILLKLGSREVKKGKIYHFLTLNCKNNYFLTV